MKNLMNLPSLLICLFASMLVLSSFSSVPVADVRDDNPPVEKTVENRRKARLNKRYNNLSQRFDKTTNTKQRIRLQKKIRNVERQQATNGSPLWGIIGLVLGVIAFALFIFALVTLARAAVVAASTGTAAATGGGVALFVAGLIAALAGVVISIVSLVLIGQNPDRHTMRGFGIAGIIIGSIFIFILAIALAIAAAAASI